MKAIVRDGKLMDHPDQMAADIPWECCGVIRALRCQITMEALLSSFCHMSLDYPRHAIEDIFF